MISGSAAMELIFLLWLWFVRFVSVSVWDYSCLVLARSSDLFVPRGPWALGFWSRWSAVFYVVRIPILGRSFFVLSFCLFVLCRLRRAFSHVSAAVRSCEWSLPGFLRFLSSLFCFCSSSLFFCFSFLIFFLYLLCFYGFWVPSEIIIYIIYRYGYFVQFA